jgi:hypothetical protein
MSQEAENELRRDLLNLDDKHTYFLLGAAGTAIGFAITRSESSQVDLYATALAFAFALWGTSFISGCMVIKRTRSLFAANRIYLDILKPFPEIEARENVKKIGKEQLEPLGRNVEWWRDLQYQTLLGGAAAYLVWQGFRMLDLTQ